MVRRCSSSLRMGLGLLALAPTSVALAQEGGIAFGASTPVAAGVDFVRLVDLNGDDRLDLLGRTSLALALPGGGYAAAVPFPIAFSTLGLTFAYQNAPAAGDVNGDGFADLLGHAAGGTLQVQLHDGAGGFTPGATMAITLDPSSWRLADFTGDGNLDALVCGGKNPNFQTLTESRLWIFAGDGAGGFALAGNTRSSGFARDVMDHDGDGSLDVVSSWWNQQSLRISTGDGAGGFPGATDLFLDWGAHGVDAANVDDDGQPDLAVAIRDLLLGVPNSLKVVLQGGATTTWVLSFGPNDVEIVDLGGDGWADVVVRRFDDSSVRILASNGTGQLTAPATQPLGMQGKRLDYADVDGDARTDIVFASAAGDAWFAPNVSARPLPWAPWIRDVEPFGAPIASVPSPRLQVRGTGLAAASVAQLGPSFHPMASGAPADSLALAVIEPPVPVIGVVPLVVTSAGGTSQPFSFPLRLADAPVLVVSPPAPLAGQPVQLAFAGPVPGDLVLLAASDCLQPLDVPPYFLLGIGGCGSVEFPLVPDPLGPAGLATLSTIVPPTLHGTIHLQWVEVNLPDLLAGVFPFATSQVVTLTIP